MSGPASRPGLARKVDFLTDGSAYGQVAGPVPRKETHMSWLFFPGDRVYKLKKPVRLPYLDFSTLERRRAACAAELRLNRRLAADIYLGVQPLILGAGGLSIGGDGEIVDWLVVMRRLDETQMLEQRLADDVRPAELDRLSAVLGRFYRRAPAIPLPAAAHLHHWTKALAANRGVLLDPRLSLPSGLVRRIDGVQRRFLRARPDLLAARARGRRIIDGHGDLRPEHIWLGPAIKVIDCLEFSARLRASDVLDEIAFLDLECERLGASWAGRRLRRRLAAALHDTAPEALYLFYRSYRAMLRARLSIAHLLEPDPRTPEKWPVQARAYLAIALRDATALERWLRRPSGR